MPSVTIRLYKLNHVKSWHMSHIADFADFLSFRPADDSHLPSANTCISRLYIPLYSRFQSKISHLPCYRLFEHCLIAYLFSKQILKAKLLMAIKTKNFGFVWFGVCDELPTSDQLSSAIGKLWIVLEACVNVKKCSCVETPEISVTLSCQWIRFANEDCPCTILFCDSLSHIQG